MKAFAVFLACLLSVSTLAAAPHVLIKTSLGDIEVELNQDKAPISVANFLSYVQSGYYAGTIFHRVYPGFVAQGGGLLPNLTEKKPTAAPIVNEAGNGLKNLRGTIAMARLPDPNSATSQFYFNLVDNSSLDQSSSNGFGYAVFGKVVNGMSVVDAMTKIPTTTVGGYEYVPTTPITILSAAVVAATPSFSASVTASGTAAAQTLDLVVAPGSADLNKAAHTFAAAVLPNGATYMLTPNGVQAFDLNAPAAFAAGYLQASASYRLISGLNTAGLAGTTIYAGYGLGTNPQNALSELLSSQRMLPVYTFN